MDFKFTTLISCKKCSDIIKSVGKKAKLEHLEERAKLLRCQGCEKLMEMQTLKKDVGDK